MGGGDAICRAWQTKTPPGPNGVPQDFVLLRSWRHVVGTDGECDEFVIANRSIEHPDIPPRDAAVCRRIAVGASGFVLRGTGAATDGAERSGRERSGDGDGNGMAARCDMTYYMQAPNQALHLLIGDLVGDQPALQQSFVRLVSLLEKPAV